MFTRAPCAEPRLRPRPRLDAVPAQPDVQLRSCEAEPPRRLGLVPIGLLQHLLNRLALERPQVVRRRGQNRLGMERQVTPLDHALLAQNCGRLEDIAQLADVARPAVRDERVARLVAEPRRWAPERIAEFGQKLLREQRDVARPLAESWQ